MAEGDDVALKLVHTADWHLGRRFPSFDEDDQKKLSRARLAVIDRILGVAEQHAAHAVLCAGDLFDEPDPGPDWWEPLARKFADRAWEHRPVFLLPGNHDPLISSSVYDPEHAFRRALPKWVHVVDRDDFSFELTPEAVLYARPCRSKAGQDDLALALPNRATGDARIRIGLTHGSTFGNDDYQTNFPIDPGAAAKRGFDYLAIGDTHGFRRIPPDGNPPTVYPGAPEPTAFDEKEPGYVAVVFVTRSRRVILERERVCDWIWEERACTELSELRGLRDGEDLKKRVMRLQVNMRLPALEYEEAKTILRTLKGTEAAHGRVGVLQLDASQLVLDTTDIERCFEDMPEVLRAAVKRLRELSDGEQAEIARRALYHLFRSVRETG